MRHIREEAKITKKGEMINSPPDGEKLPGHLT